MTLKASQQFCLNSLATSDTAVPTHTCATAEGDEAGPCFILQRDATEEKTPERRTFSLVKTCRTNRANFTMNVLKQGDFCCEWDACHNTNGIILMRITLYQSSPFLTFQGTLGRGQRQLQQSTPGTVQLKPGASSGLTLTITFGSASFLSLLSPHVVPSSRYKQES